MKQDFRNVTKARVASSVIEPRRCDDAESTLSHFEPRMALEEKKHSSGSHGPFHLGTCMNHIPDKLSERRMVQIPRVRLSHFLNHPECRLRRLSDVSNKHKLTEMPAYMFERTPVIDMLNMWGCVHLVCVFSCCAPPTTKRCFSHITASRRRSSCRQPPGKVS